jgi:ketosteroid isomerase-like protein
MSSLAGMKLFPAIIAVAVLCFSGACRDRSQTETSMRSSPEQEQAIRVLREAYAAFNRGDIAAAVAQLDPQIDWTEPAEFPGGGTYRGQDGVAAYLTQSRAAWAEVNSEPERFIPADDRIVVFVHARVRPKDSTGWQEVRLADVYTFRNGKAVSMRAFADRQEALRWAGIKE